MVNAEKRQRDEGRIGSILAVIGCLGLLTLTFGAGFYSGRIWNRAAPSGPAGPAVQASPVPTSRGSAVVATAARPTLTFYEELTAPAPPPPAPAPSQPKAAVGEPRRAVDKPEPPPARADDKSGRADKREASPRKVEPDSAAPRFTVQIAAYSLRASAEALRNTMTATGHVAYIVESDSPPGAPRYRVRVGSYATREAAIAAASRLPVAGARYVTSR